MFPEPEKDVQPAFRPEPRERVLGVKVARGETVKSANENIALKKTTSSKKATLKKTAASKTALAKNAVVTKNAAVKKIQKNKKVNKQSKPSKTAQKQATVKKMPAKITAGKKTLRTSAKKILPANNRNTRNRR